MFHYRLRLTDNRQRILIALLVAIVAHIGVMRYTFERTPITMPKLVLPRSVSVLLGNRQVPVRSVKAPEAGIVTEPAILPPIPAVQKKSDRTPGLAASPVSGNNSRKLSEIGHSRNLPAIDRTIPVIQNPAAALAELQAGSGTPAENGEQDAMATPPIDAEGEGGIKAGAIQTAFPRYQVNSPPTYPGLARKRGQEGTVILQVLVNSTGKVDDLRIENSSGSVLLDRAAESAVRTWLFEPARRGHKTIAMWVRVPIVFKLRD